MERRRSRPPDAEAKANHDTTKRICRCCLTTEKLLKNALDVQEYFMELAGINVSVSDGMPPWVCVECSALMKKGISFKYKMIRAQSVLYDYLMKCAPGQFDVNDPELTRFRAPNLSTTRTLAFDSVRERYGFHDILQQEKQLSKTDLFSVPLLPMFENPCSALESVEAAFSDLEDDPLERNQTEKKVIEDDDNDNDNDNDDNEDKDDTEDNDKDNDNDDNVDEDDLIDDEDDDEDMEDFEEEEDEMEEMSSDTEEDSDSEPLVKKKGKKKKKKDIKMEKISYSAEEELMQPPEITWTSENDEILIEFVKRNEALYNPKSKTYKIGVLKKKLWIDIGTILNKSDVECCKRWNYVRDYYIRRRGKRASGGEAARRRAALLAFLDHVPSTARAGWPRDPPEPSQQPEPVKEESTTNFEHLWEQIRIGDQFSKMSGVAWTSAKEELLIDFVRRHDALYNPRSKDFRKPQVKQKLWCDIGTLLNKSDTDCSKRWCYVRDYYTRRKSNPGALSTGKAAKRRAELLAFLDYVPPPGRAPLSPLPPQESLMKEEMESTRFDNSAHSSDYRGTTYSKMSSNATWTSDNDERLIAFVRRNESLFNAKSKDFRKARMKQRLWREIGSILKKSDSDCYKRWCYVRDYYIRRRGKPGVLSTGKAARRRAELLSFLDDVPAAARSAQEALKAERRESETLEGAISDLFREQYSKMTSNVTWTWENDEKLIKFVRRNEPLYNPKSRNTQLKQKLWNEIAAQLNKTDADCCKRWCYVRDYYRRRSKFAPCGESARRRAQLLAFLDRVPSVPRGSGTADI